MGIAAVVYATTWLFGSPSTPQPTTTTPSGTNSGLLYPVSVAADPNVSASSGSASTSVTINAKNFLEDPDTHPDPYNQGHYFLGNMIDPTPGAPAPQYVIEYQARTQYFNVALLQEPIGSARQAAEQGSRSIAEKGHAGKRGSPVRRASGFRKR